MLLLNIVLLDCHLWKNFPSAMPYHVVLAATYSLPAASTVPPMDLPVLQIPVWTVFWIPS